MYKNFLLILLVTILNIVSVFSMIYDNRFFPWYETRVSRTTEKPSWIIFPDVFLVTGHEAFGFDDKNEGIPEIFGLYDEAQMARAVEVLGFPNPLPFDLQNAKILWDLQGKIEGQGIALQYNQQLWCYLSGGISCFAMHLFTRHDFALTAETISHLGLTLAEVDNLDQIRREMNQQVGLEAPKNDVGGFSDIDCYLRLGNVWNYAARFKRIDAGAKIGLLFRTTMQRTFFII